MDLQNEISFQTLADNEDVQVGYFDNDIMFVDSIQQFTEVSHAHVSMNTIVICTQGKVQGVMNGKPMELHKNQVAIFPKNITASDVMVSPDFNMKGMFLTNRILQSFLREKMNVWNEMMFIHRQYIATVDDEKIASYTQFCDMLAKSIEHGRENPYFTDIMQSMLRSAILAICGAMKMAMPAASNDISSADSYFQRFMDLLQSTKTKHRMVEDYASSLCISPKYLTAICKKKSGKTANEWITEHVVEDIRYYLKQTDLSIKQICDRMGFPNTSFFCKYVKDHFNMTPLTFRNS